MSQQQPTTSNGLQASVSRDPLTHNAKISVMGTLDFSQVVAPENVQVDSQGIIELVDALDADPLIAPHALLIARHAQLITRGSWEPYRPDQPGLVYSLSKSFAITGLGIAVQEGLVALDEPVLAAFPECDDASISEYTRRISVKHMAMMSSGHATGMWPLLRATAPDELFRAFFHTPPAKEPGTLFAYNQMATYSIAEIIHRRTGIRFLDWLRPRLLEPLGVDAADWQQLVPGMDLGFTGLFVSPDAIAALAQLYLNGGEYGGVRIVPEWWVHEATRYQISNAHWSPDTDWKSGYGYHFWMCQHGFRGDGAFGQYCLVLPEQDMIVALTSETFAMQRVLDLVWQHLLPAVERTPDTSGSNDPLAGRTLPLPFVIGDSDLGKVCFESRQPHTQVAGGATIEDDLTLIAVRHVAVKLDAAVGTLVLSDDNVSLCATLRIGEWTTTAREASCPFTIATAAAVDAETLRVSVVFLETPHRLELICERASGRCVADWVTPALLGSSLSDLGFSGA
ncbi:MAG: beta-lactamase family protein [Propionibacteriaceae bacterium]|nr:beta-lactamase family protein [Propionibacteriaceae bacterium]